MNPKSWLINFLGGGGVSESGVNVSPDSMMSESAVWCAVNFLASNIGSLPCPIYRIEGRKKLKARNHPLYGCLNDRANEEMISMVFRETMLYHLFFWGVHVSVVERDMLNRVRALWPVHPDRVRIERVRGRLVYWITDSEGREDRYDRDEVLHIPALGLNGLFGNPMINYSRDSIGLMLAMRSFANLFFKNGAHMGIVLEHPKRLSAEASTNLRNQFAAKYAGLGKSHNAVVAEEGMKVNKVGVDPDASQLIEGRQFQIQDVARWFNLPPHVLKDLSRATFSNIESQALELVKYSIRPWLVRIEQSIKAWLLSDANRKNHIVRHNLEGLLRGDSAARADFYQKQFFTGSITPNEIRELEDRNPIDEKWADEPYIQVNMVPLRVAAELNEDDGADSTPRSARAVERRSLKSIAAGRDRVRNRFTPMIRDAAQKVVNRETIAIKREVKRQLGERAASDFDAWIDEFYRSHEGYVADTVGPVLRSYAETMADVVGGEVDFEMAEEELRAEIDKYLNGYVRQYMNESIGQLRTLLAEEAGLELIEARADEWHEKRAEKITMDQGTSVMGMVARAVILGAGYKLVWRNRGKSCPFCQQLEGRVVSKVGQPFLKSGTELDGGEAGTITTRQTLFPPLHKGCDCLCTPE